jgi:DNA adenine methylase
MLRTPAGGASKPPVAPFLRWAGGKRWLARTVSSLLPARTGSYYEPFLGSGALYFKIGPPSGHLADSNPDLIEAFRVVRDSPSELVSSLSRIKYSRSEYYKRRAETPGDSIERAVRFIFLNRTCWNGLYRVNRNGGFNVPYGRKPTRLDVADENIGSASRALKGATLDCQDFERTLQRVGPGAFIFADPPYSVAHENNGFVSYNERIFSWDDQVRLCLALERASERGAKFLLTNADHESIRQLYRRFRLRPLVRSSIIAADSANRRRVSELVIMNYMPQRRGQTSLTTKSRQNRVEPRSTSSPRAYSRGVFQKAGI